MRAQGLEQNFLVFFRHRLVERALARRLGQQFGDAALEIGLHARMRCGLPPKAAVECR